MNINLTNDAKIKSNASQKDIKLFVAPKCFLYRFETRYTVELCRIGFL